MLRPRRVLMTVLLAVTTLTVVPGVSAAAQPPLPRVMAATGDSITRAFDVDWLCCFLSDGPSRSWSTGTDSAINSHYQRLQRFDARLGAGYNDARSGARMVELEGQLNTAASQSANYVTVLMGANDVCTSSVATMTPTEAFESQFRQALSTFVAARPHARVFVASIPDVYRLWQLFHNDPYVTAIWSTFNICQSLLRPSNTEEVRQQVVARLQSFNAVLADVCREFRQCLWDANEVYDTKFDPVDVSTIDYFHPSIRGQQRLAAVTWAAGYWPDRG